MNRSPRVYFLYRLILFSLYALCFIQQIIQTINSSTFIDTYFLWEFPIVGSLLSLIDPLIYMKNDSS
jgi:CRISPR/Cas system-associated protein Cas10 (large subunit of type III CRISPR-Cas system)